MTTQKQAHDEHSYTEQVRKAIRSKNVWIEMRGKSIMLAAEWQKMNL